MEDSHTSPDGDFDASISRLVVRTCVQELQVQCYSANPGPQRLFLSCIEILMCWMSYRG